MRRDAGIGMVRAPERYWPVSDSRLAAFDLPQRSLRHQLSAQPPGAGAKIDHVIRAFNGLGVVLDNQHCVAQVSQPG